MNWCSQILLFYIYELKALFIFEFPFNNIIREFPHLNFAHDLENKLVV